MKDSKQNRIIGIALGNFWRWSKNLNRAELLEYASRLDCRGVEITLGKKEEVFNFQLTQQQLEFLQSQKYVSIHAPFRLLSNSGTEDEIQRQLNVIQQIYAKINAKTVVIHPNELPSPEVLDRFSMHISTENMPAHKVVQLDSLAELMEKHENIGLCLDIAHAFSVSKRHGSEIVQRFRDRITQVHLSGHRKGEDHVSLKIADEGFNEILSLLSQLDVPVIIEEDMQPGIDPAKAEVEYIKRLLDDL